MEKVFAHITKKLKEQSISLIQESLQKYHTQGLISEVYVAQSNVGDLIIQVVHPIPEQIHLKLWEKFIGISNMVQQHPEIPASEVLLVERLSDVYVLIQKRIPGTSSGERVIDGVKITDKWNIDLKQHLNQIETIIAQIHHIHVEGYGWLIPKGDWVRGKNKSWLEFVQIEGGRWIEGIRAAESIVQKNDSSELITRLEKFLLGISALISFEDRASLIHGDAINPSNILVREGKITGIVDWEWSIAGDPAWEFAFGNKYPLATYFECFPDLYTSQLRKEFLARTEIYKLLWFMCHGHIHSWNPRGLLYQTVRAYLISLSKEY